MPEQGWEKRMGDGLQWLKGRDGRAQTEKRAFFLQTSPSNL